MKDRIGKTWNRLTAMRPAPKGKGHWIFQCACGAITTATIWSVRKGIVKSCGCYRDETLKSGVLRRRHGMTNSPENYAWRHMLSRCRNPKNKNFADYGGRGIEVRYVSFQEFLDDLGPRPAPGYTVDRLNVNGHYEPGNCRWATRLEQGEHKRNNTYITHNGRTLHLSAWARDIGISKDTLRQRISRYGWSVDRALTTPVK